MNNAEYLNECGTKLSAMDRHLALATEYAVAGDPTAARLYISQAHSLLAEAGLALAWVAHAVIGAPAPGGSAPPAPPPVPTPAAWFTSGTRAEFDAWLPTTPQAVILDGTRVKDGFGPAALFYSDDYGRRISNEPAPPIEVPSNEIEAPYVPPAEYKVAPLDPYIVGVSGVGIAAPKLTMQPGVIYAIPLVLPPTPGLWEWSMCEFQGEPAPHTTKLSLTEGDLPLPPTDYNLTPSVMIDVTNDGPYRPGATVYVNTTISEPFPRVAPVHYDCLPRN